MFLSRTIFLSLQRQRIYLPKIENPRMWQQRNKWRQIEMLSVYLKLCGLTRQDRLPIGSFSTKSTLSWRPSRGNPKHSKIGNACCLPPYSIVSGCEILSTCFNILHSSWWSHTTRLRDSDHPKLISWAFCFLLQFVKHLLKGWTHMLSLL